MNYRIISRKKLEIGILARWLFLALGDRKGTHVVIDNNDVVYYIGSLEECKNYIIDDEEFFRELNHDK
jgi:hypothetical protein